MNKDDDKKTSGTKTEPEELQTEWIINPEGGKEITDKKAEQEQPEDIDESKGDSQMELDF